jgi:alpha-beta hydrolase superfamily lysophospholipase
MTTTTATAMGPEQAIANQRRFEGFPVGYYDLHPDFRMNYEMNRFSTGEADMIEEMRSVSPRIHDIRDYAREFFTLGQAALGRGEKLKGAFYLRGAEFCMFGDDPRRQPARRQFIELMREHFDFGDNTHFNVPYESSALSAYRLPPPAQPKGTIVVFGGFDSYIEEWFPMQRYFANAGYDVVGFDGPGQGSTLEDGHLHLTHEWHKPVGAVLDYFKLDNVTLIGISLGGCLALRAAAYESRVHRVVADDICANYLEVTLALAKPSVQAALASLLKMGADQVIDTLFERARKGSASTDFAVQQGMLVTGSETPSGYLKRMHLYRTDDVSPLIEQDVLLLGGSEDFCIPLHQFYDQIPMLTHARSVTARLFTRQEQGQQHCQIGNLGLQFRVIKDWIEIMQQQEEMTR